MTSRQPSTRLLVTLLFLIPVLRAQDPTPPPPPEPARAAEEARKALEDDRPPPPDEADARRLEQEVETVVITASRRAQSEIAVPRAMNVVGAVRVRERGVLSVADAADDQIGVWTEKRAAHTSDFVIRGLSGGNLLALVDGNTLSTFWGEGGFAGDDLYGKIDPELVDRIEIVRGPSSVLYGSNALGAVVNFLSRSSPFDYPAEGVLIGTRTRVLTSTAPSLWRFREEFYGASPEVRWLVGGTYWEAGGTRDGSGQNQRPTGGDGWYGDGRLDWKIDAEAFLTLTFQQTENAHVYRYYRPNQVNSNRRSAVAGTLDLGDLDWGFADEARFKLYVQHKRDERRWFSASTGAETQEGIASWDTLQSGAQFTKRWDSHVLTYGLDIQSTAGESPDDEQFTTTTAGGTPVKAAPDSIWSSAGLFAEDTWEVASWLSLTGSARFDVFRFATDVDPLYVPPGGLDPDVDEFTDYEAALVGGLQAVFHLSETTNAYAGWTRGFRQFAPHFGVTQHAWGVVVPSQLLDPVTADLFEVGLKHRGRRFEADLAVYDTIFDDFQNVVRGAFQGQDWYDYNQNGIQDANELVYETTGNGEAYVYGAEAQVRLNLAAVSEDLFGEWWTAGAGFMWNYGRDRTNDIPLRHTHPARGLFSLRYDRPDLGFWVEATAEVVRHYDRIPPDRLANDVGYLEDPQVPSSGMRRAWGLPGYSVFDLRGGVELCANASLTFGLENVLDKLYRPAHARWDAPGRAVWVALEVTF